MNNFLSFLLIVLSVLITNGCLPSTNIKEVSPRNTKILEKAIREQTKYRELDELCMQIPLPSDSVLLGKVGLFNTNGINYFYNSKSQFPEIKRIFDNYFRKKTNWKSFEYNFVGTGARYGNGKYTVEISYGEEDSDFSVFCGLSSEIEKDEYNKSNN